MTEEEALGKFKELADNLYKKDRKRKVAKEAKELEDTKIEVVGQYKAIQIATDTIIKEDGVELSRSRHRRVIHPSSADKNTDTGEITVTQTDISGESAEIQAVCNAVWTNSVKSAWETKIKADFP